MKNQIIEKLTATKSDAAAWNFGSEFRVTLQLNTYRDKNHFYEDFKGTRVECIKKANKFNKMIAEGLISGEVHTVWMYAYKRDKKREEREIGGVKIGVSFSSAY